ncbi:unnamed protein product [Rotaria magnacalcarata]|uniref:Uncharacterized protein n=1 Tax=Rotaria magnacalcarata TaxID=392030 RepID=A0A814IAS6_9BILA|nr:unnamed protein product [Rotaria magnacalcarata]
MIDSTTNTNICSDLSAITADNKAISTGTEKGKKRATPLPPAGQAKNNMTVHHSCGEQAPKVTSTCVDQSKFVTAAEIYIKVRGNVQIMPEPFDEELFEMTIKFGKKYPQ